MRYLVINWLISSVSLLIVAHVVPGFQVDGFVSALIAAAVVALVSVTVGLLLKILLIPLTLITFGLFLIIINAIVLKLAASVMPGFRIIGFLPAILGAVLLTVVQWLLRSVLL